MQSLPAGGAMAAVFAPPSELFALISDYRSTVSVAAVTGHGQTVISGAAPDIDAICAALGARGVRVQRLTVSHAFHSPLVEPIVDAFELKASKVAFAPPRLALISNVTGGLADATLVTSPSYWKQHIRATVEFARGLASLAKQAPDVCLELGPHPTLLAFAAEAFDGAPPVLLSSLAKNSKDHERLDESLAALFLAARGSIGARFGRVRRCRRSTCRPMHFSVNVTGSVTTRAVGARTESGHPLLGVRLQTALSDIVQFQSELSPTACRSYATIAWAAV